MQTTFVYCTPTNVVHYIADDLFVSATNSVPSSAYCPTAIKNIHIGITKKLFPDLLLCD